MPKGPEKLLTPPVLDAKMAAKYVRDNFPDFADERQSLKYVGEGMDNTVFRTKNGYFFRFAKDIHASKANESEIRVLPLLQKHLAMKIPNIEYAGIQNSGYHFFGYKGIEGAELSKVLIEGMNSGSYDRVLEDLGKMINELRAFPLEPAQAAGVIEQDTRQFFSMVEQKLLNDPGELTVGEQTSIQGVFRGYLEDGRNFSHAHVLTHADLGPAHIRYDEQNARIAGVIDWSDMVITDPAFELQDIYQNYGERFARDLLAKMGADVDAEIRSAKFFTIARNLNRYIRRMRRGDVRAETNLHIIRSEIAEI